MRLRRFGHTVRKADALTALLVAAAVAVYAARTARSPQPLETPFGRPLPAALAQRLDALGAGHSLGDARAPVRVVELADYECGACAAAHDSIWPWMEPLVREGRVRYTVYHYPLPTHERAIPAATVLECAAGDGAGFWTLRSALLARQAEWAPPPEGAAVEGERAGAAPADPIPALLAIAEGTGADPAQTRDCLARRGDTLRRDLAAASAAVQEAGLTFTPVYAVDGEIVFWGELRERLEDLLGAR